MCGEIDWVDQVLCFGGILYCLQWYVGLYGKCVIDCVEGQYLIYVFQVQYQFVVCCYGVIGKIGVFVGWYDCYIVFVCLVYYGLYFGYVFWQCDGQWCGCLVVGLVVIVVFQVGWVGQQVQIWQCGGKGGEVGLGYGGVLVWRFRVILYWKLVQWCIVVFCLWFWYSDCLFCVVGLL